jgi:general secretion pathway protein D
MKRYWAGALAAALVVGVLAAVSVHAESTSAVPQNQITMNFQNVDIPVLAKFISEITGKNFIVDESVRGKVSIISPTKVTPEQAYQVFQSVLKMKGFTTVEAGKVIKIVPSRDVRSQAPLTQAPSPEELRGDEFVTRMVKLKNVDATSMVNVVQPMISHDGLVAAYPEDNTLIITDDAYNVDRLLKIIGSLDIQGTQESVTVIPLKLAFAGELAPEIEQIMSARSGTPEAGREVGGRPMLRPQMGVVAPAAAAPASGFRVIPDERTNSLIVLAGPIQMKQIAEIVQKLDVVSPNATQRIHVYHLHNAEALEMVQVLGSLIGGSGMPTTLSPTTGRGSLGRGSSLGLYNGGAFGSGFGGLGGGMGSSSSGMGSSFGTMGGGGMGGGGFGSGMGMMRGSGSGMGGSSGFAGGSSGAGGSTTVSSGSHNPDFNSPVSITADPATNALVVSAAPQDWQTLHTIIDQLDQPRVQVFVQAVIVEVSAERQKQLGINFNASTNISGSTIGVGQLNFGQLQNALGNPLGLSGLGLGLASGSQCSIPVSLASGAISAAAGAVGAATGSGTGSTGGSTTLTVPCDFALMTALEVDSHANVLSAPTLLTADNEEAMIVVGENVPFVGSAAANAGLPGQIFNQVDRQNVGITLDVVPQVSEGDYVKLDLYEEVSNVVGSTVNSPLGPTTTIRSASTSVLVENHRTAVIGGLLASNDNIQNQGVPYLSNLPVIGNLFSFKSSDKQKQNLLVFLTPHVIRNHADLRSLALDERQKFVNSLGRKELHDMPASQIREVYKPNFSIAVPPSADLNAPYGASPATPGPENPAAASAPPSSGGEGSSGAENPFNTEEIPGPSTMNKTGGSSAPALASAESAPPPAAAAPEPAAVASPAAPEVVVPAAASAVVPATDLSAAKAAAEAPADSASP